MALKGGPKMVRWARAQLLALLQVFPEIPLAVLGSYAGAVGLVQFLPGSIQRFGVDWDQDGKIYLDSLPDALASAANYLEGRGLELGAADPARQRQLPGDLRLQSGARLRQGGDRAGRGFRLSETQGQASEADQSQGPGAHPSEAPAVAP